MDPPDSRLTAFSEAGVLFEVLLAADPGRECDRCGCLAGGGVEPPSAFRFTPLPS